MPEETDRHRYPNPKIATGSILNSELLPQETLLEKLGRQSSVKGLNLGH